MTRLALWGGYMTGMGVDIVSELMAGDEIFAQVLEAEQDWWGDKRNRFMQWRDEKREMDARSQLYNAERRGREEGRAEGETIGLAKGRAEGREEGREEGIEIGGHKKSVTIARNLFKMGFSVEQVTQAADLTVSEAEEIQRQMILGETPKA